MRALLFPVLFAAVVSPLYHANAEASRIQQQQQRHSPGTVIIVSGSAVNVAFRFADRLADGGVIVLVRQTDSRSPEIVRAMALGALDSLRRRADVQTDRIGLIAVGNVAPLVGALAADTSLAFVVTVSPKPDSRDTSSAAIAHLLTDYEAARTPTLVLRSRSIHLDTAARTVTQSISSLSNESQSQIGGDLRLMTTVGAYVTIWPVAETTLTALTEPPATIVDDVVAWVRDRVLPGRHPGSVPTLAGVTIGVASRVR